MSAASRPRLVRTAGLISAATLLSRVLGLVREQLFAALMGASMFADAFVIAFRIPNLLRDLFAEGALAQAFVPSFRASLERDGKPAAFTLANRVAGTLAFVTFGLVLAGGLFARPLMGAIAGGFDQVPGKLDLAVLLARVMMPFLVIVSLSAAAMGMLNAQDRYATPALAPAVFNLTAIAIGLVLHGLGLGGQLAAIGWAIGTLCGGLAQLAIQIPALLRTGYRPHLALDLGLRDPGVRRVARLMLPAVLGVAAVQINVVINAIFATGEPGAAAWLNYGFRFLQFPIGVFGVAIATVSTTRYADAAALGDRPALAGQLGESLRLTALLTVPATVGLLVLGEPIVRLIYQHGRFGGGDTLATSAALHFYALGLPSYAAVKVAAPAFYALGRARIPLVASLAAVAGNLGVSLALHDRLGFRALALGTAIGASLNFAVLYLAAAVAVPELDHRRLATLLLKVALAAALMGGAVWLAHRGLAARLDDGHTLARAALAFVPIGLGVAVYGGALIALQVEELGALRRRRRT